MLFQALTLAAFAGKAFADFSIATPVSGPKDEADSSLRSLSAVSDTFSRSTDHLEPVSISWTDGQAPFIL